MAEIDLSGSVHYSPARRSLLKAGAPINQGSSV